MVLVDLKTPEHYNPKIFYAGIFDYDKLIKTIANWFNIQGFEFKEEYFKHKVPTPAGSEPEFKYHGWMKLSEYVQYWIFVQAHLYELKEVDVMIDGVKKKMAKGKIMLTFSDNCILDYNNKFNTPVAKKIQDFLHKHIWNKQITGGWTDELYYRKYKLHREVKEALGMSTTTNASEVRY
jgi:hypothetical protein